MHCSRLAAAYMGMLPQGTSTNNKWAAARASNRSLNRDSFADNMPVPGNPGYKVVADDNADGQPEPKRSKRSTYCPFSHNKLAEMDKGPQSNVYRPALDKYLKRKREVLTEKHGRTSNLAQRPFKVQVILVQPEGCTCLWDPGVREWVRDCATCGPGKTYTAVYVYDRGLSQTHAMIVNGVRVLIPSRKKGGQIAFADATNASDRHISRERITIERGNLELRYYDGFDCQIQPSSVDLAGWEGSAARGLCNLRIELTDWTQRSYKGTVVDLTL